MREVKVSNNPIRIRIGSEYAGDRDTQTFTDSTFAEAVAALQGDHSEGHHKDTPVYVVRVHETTHTVEGDCKRTRTVEYKAGEPLFGERVTIYGRRPAWGSVPKDAEVSFGAGGSTSTQEMRDNIAILTLATEIAEAANAEPYCAKCQKEFAEQEEKFRKAVK